MTPRELKNSTISYLLIAYKNKRVCQHSHRTSVAIYNELRKRLTFEEMYPMSLGGSHYDLGEGCTEFYTECEKLIKKYSV